MTGPDDPRVTAYALGEGAPADRRAVEAAMAADPSVAAAVEATRALAATARGALATDGEAGLGADARARVLAALPRRRVSTGALLAWGAGLAAAAAAVVAVVARPWESLPRTVETASVEGAREARRLNTAGYERAQAPVEEPPPASGPRGAEAGSGAGAGGGPSPFAGGVSAWEDGGASGGGGAGGGVRLLTPGEVAVGQGRAPAGGVRIPPGPANAGGQGAGGRVVVNLEEVTNGLEAPPAGPGLPAGRALNPSAGIYFNDGQDGDFRGRAEGLFEQPLSGGATPPAPDGTETYDEAVEGDWALVAKAPLSTFGVDVDTASYANLRRMLRDGRLPPPQAVRVEELLNYFPYAYASPTDGAPFAVRLEVASCPWAPSHRLVRVALKAREIERAARPPMNLVFLLDVSGSMDSPQKLPLVQASMRMLLEELHERDTVAIVTYAGASGVLLPPTSCERKPAIQDAIDRLRAGGSTNGAAGIQQAYEVARQAFLKDGANRVVLATDGDFNVGVTSREDLLALIEREAKSGVFLTCLGFGMGNLKDATLEALADRGNGVYGYVDSTREARKLLVEGASGTLVTVAKDAKIQVEFNPSKVEAYRLVGYDNRRLAPQDFADDRKDAGEVGAGHAVTALYEVVPAGGKVPEIPAPPTVEPLRYGPKAPATPAAAPAGDPASAELLVVKVRYKRPDADASERLEVPLTDGGGDYAKASGDFKFAASVAAFALVLKGSRHRGTATLEAVQELAGEGLSFDPSGYRAEFVDLVARARALTPGR